MVLETIGQITQKVLKKNKKLNFKLMSYLVMEVGFVSFGRVLRKDITITFISYLIEMLDLTLELCVSAHSEY